MAQSRVTIAQSQGGAQKWSRMTDSTQCLELSIEVDSDYVKTATNNKRMAMYIAQMY